MSCPKRPLLGFPKESRHPRWRTAAAALGDGVGGAGLGGRVVGR
uniref:Uncharacterized protein n=1 Tax=Arundo donax TaxID=35708 RepID=A0A0A8ZLV9_ARUDO